MKRDGSVGNSRGDYTIMIEWSWRIESEYAILYGSWSDEEDWQKAFKSLIGCKIQDVSLFGRLPEVSISLTGGFYITSFMTAEGQPAWTIFGNFGDQNKSRCIAVCDGNLYEEMVMEKSAVAIDPSH